MNNAKDTEIEEIPMKRYDLLVIAEELHQHKVFAQSVVITEHVYQFIYEGSVVAFYPVNRTIIRNIEEAER